VAVEIADGSMLLAPTEERFEIVKLLGRGGMGEVYQARDHALDADVALKSLRAHVAQDPRVLARFRREAKLARRIKHVNVAQVHDLVEFRGQRYLCMEYVDGRSLRDILAVKTRLPVHVVLSLMRQVCLGVHAAHDVGVIHRDLKPHNIMVTRRDGRACILDFGIAREVDDEDLTEHGVILGSPQYLSYDQLAGWPATPRSDVYQLGIVLYEMLTGISPFRAPGARTAALKALREVPPDPRHVDPRIPDFVAAAVLRCLQPDPSDRFASALDIALALEPQGADALQAKLHEPAPILELDSGPIHLKGAPRAIVAVPALADREAVLDRLGRLGISVTTAADGEEALRLAGEGNWSLVVLAGDLARVDGLTACQILRRSGGPDAPPVMLLLPPGDDGRIAFAREAGAADVIHAPLNPHAFSRKVRDLVVA
jgi:serine/threonine protein kinase